MAFVDVCDGPAGRVDGGLPVEGFESMALMKCLRILAYLWYEWMAWIGVCDRAKRHKTMCDVVKCLLVEVGKLCALRHQIYD